MPTTLQPSGGQVTWRLCLLSGGWESRKEAEKACALSKELWKHWGGKIIHSLIANTSNTSKILWQFVQSQQARISGWYTEGGGITADRVRKPRTKGISSHDSNAPKLFNLGRWQCEARTFWVYLELNATDIAYIYMFPKGRRCLVANLVPGKSDGIFRRLGPVDGGLLLRGILTLDPFITYTPISWPLSCEQSPTPTLLDLSPEIHRVLRPRIKNWKILRQNNHFFY